MSRRSKYDPKHCELAESLLSEGYSQAVVAGQLRVDEDTITNWKKRNPEFREAIERGLAAGRLFWERLGIQGASGQIKDFNAATWIFNMKNRFGWRDKMDHEFPEGISVVARIVREIVRPDDQDTDG